MQYQTAYERYQFVLRVLRDISPTLAHAVEECVTDLRGCSDASEYALKPGDRCPKCGSGTIVLRTKSDPPFLGCSEFKNGGCRFSASCTREQAQQWISEGRTGYKQQTEHRGPFNVHIEPFVAPDLRIRDVPQGEGSGKARPINDLVNRSIESVTTGHINDLVNRSIESRETARSFEKDMPF